MQKSDRLFGYILVLVLVCCVVPAVHAEDLSAHHANVSSSNNSLNAPVVFSGTVTERAGTEVNRDSGTQHSGGPLNSFGKHIPRGISGDGVAISMGAIPVSGSLDSVPATGTGDYIFQWAVPSSSLYLQCPYDVVVDSTGNVYVVDTDDNRIVKYSSTGTFIKQWGSYGTGNGQFDYPCGIAVDSSGNVYVADTDNNRIQKFTSNGTYLMKWGSYGTENKTFNYPCGIAVDSSGNVYVADTGNNRIQKFTSTGTYLTQWGTQGSGNGQFDYPGGIAVDSNRNVYVADSGNNIVPVNNRIQKFTSSGTYLTQWGSFGGLNGQFNSPHGIAVDSLGNVYVADRDNSRIQKFSPKI